VDTNDLDASANDTSASTNEETGSQHAFLESIMTYEQAYERLYNTHLDAVDAAVFNGDIFHNEDNRKKFRTLLERWTREMDVLDESGFGLNP